MLVTKILLCIIFYLCPKVEPNAELIERMFMPISKAVNECAAENDVPEQVIDQMRRYWMDDFTPSEEIGCVLHCAFLRTELVNSDGSVSEKNIFQLLKSNDADDQTANKIVQMLIQFCPTRVPDCAGAMVFAECFRLRVRKYHWDPISRNRHHVFRRQAC